MKKIIILIIFVIFCTYNIFAQEKFSPWDPDVKIGDEYIKINYQKNNKPDIFNSPQGGLYILLRWYQVFISSQDGPNCRYNPTCSHYAKQAVYRYGAIVGSFLAGDRLLRCNPFNPPGDDPVPESLFGGKNDEAAYER